MSAPPITLVTGQPTSVPVQCRLRGTGTTPAVFNSTDILSSAIYQTNHITNIFSPTVAWYTANGTQNGYGQGQVEASFSASGMAMLTPTISYTLLVWRALVGAPSVLELIARIPLVIETIAV